MAYNHQLIQEIVGRAIDLSATADRANWAPGFVPVYIHGIYAAIGNDIGATGVIKVDKRPTFGSDTSRGDGDVGTLNLTTAHTGGKVVYKELSPPVLISPGEQIVFEVTDAAAASDVADVGILYSMDWERPANISAMVATS